MSKINNFLNRIILCGTLVALLIALPHTASARTPTEVLFYAGGGLSPLIYQLHDGKTTPHLGYQVGVGGTYFRNSHWGIHGGLELASYSTTAALGSSVRTTWQTDDQRRNFEYREVAYGYSEQQKVSSLNIPLFIYYQHSPKQVFSFYYFAGVKLNLIQKATYKASADSIRLMGYYPNDDVVISNLPHHGFGVLRAWSSSGSIDLSSSLSASVEAGVRMKQSLHLTLYLGVYGELGINNSWKGSQNTPLTSYESQGITQSKGRGVLATGNTTQVRITSVGVRLRLSLAFPRKRSLGGQCDCYTYDEGPMRWK